MGLRKTHPKQAVRGFTLVELLVTLGIVSVLMVGVAAVAIGQSNAFEQSARTREAIANNRGSLALIERTLRMAGWGVNPLYAFNFSAARDHNDKPDELVFFARDPTFNRRATSTSSSSVTLDAELNQTLYPGQVMELICPSGQGVGYVTLSATSAAGSTSLSLQTSTGAFPTQAVPSCSGEPAFVLKVDRYRYFVADVSDGSASARPYLLLDQGLFVGGARPWDSGINGYTEMRDPTPGDGVNALGSNELLNVVPLAANVEDFQVTYAMNRPDVSWTVSPTPSAPDTDGTWVFGDDTSSSSEQPNPTASTAGITDSYLDSRRFSAHPANIRGVRVFVVARSDKAVDARSVRPAVGNHIAATAQTNYWRDVITTQVFPRNMLSRSEFAPVQVSQ